MLRLAALLCLAAVTPAEAATATGAMQIGVVVTGLAARTPAARQAARSFAKAPARRISIERDGGTLVKLIYY